MRAFTPLIEAGRGGHATLASAHVLWETGALAADATARFATRSGELTAARRGAWIELVFPTSPVDPVEPPAGLVEALGVAATHVARTRFDYLVEVATESEVRAAAPDFAGLRRTPCRGIMVTRRATSRDCDFVSRFFAPAVGVDEDPVTGSAHCALTPYWAAKLGKRDLVAHQVSERGGVLRVHLDGERVRLAGQAVSVLRGELLLEPEPVAP